MCACVAETRMHNGGRPWLVTLNGSNDDGSWRHGRRWERVCTCTFSYHAVHSEVVVLGLQLDSVLVVPPDLCVAGEEKPLVVHDPVKHLHTGE